MVCLSKCRHACPIPVMRILAIFIVVMLLAGLAAPGLADIKYVENDVHTTFNKVQRSLYSKSPPNEQKIIEAISLKITDGANPLGAFATINNGNRYVVITHGYLRGLYLFFIATELEREFKINDFSEHILYCYLQMILYDNATINIYEMAGDIPADTQSEISSRAKLFLLMSLIPVFAHEFGHHVTDGIYQKDTPDIEKRIIEKRADAWAWRALARSKDPGLGAVFSLAYLNTLDIINIHGGHPGSHPEPGDRMELALEETLNNMDNLVDDPSLQHKFKQDIIEALRLVREGREQDKKRNSKYYEERAGRLITKYAIQTTRGGPRNKYLMEFAAADYYRSALILIQGPEAGDDNDRAIKLLWNAAVKMDYAPAHNYLGFLYQNGRILKKDNSKARYHYKKAADKGYRESIERLKNM